MTLIDSSSYELCLLKKLPDKDEEILSAVN